MRHWFDELAFGRRCRPFDRAGIPYPHPVGNHRGNNLTGRILDRFIRAVHLPADRAARSRRTTRVVTCPMGKRMRAGILRIPRSFGGLRGHRVPHLRTLKPGHRIPVRGREPLAPVLPVALGPRVLIVCSVGPADVRVRRRPDPCAQHPCRPERHDYSRAHRRHRGSITPTVAPCPTPSRPMTPRSRRGIEGSVASTRCHGDAFAGGGSPAGITLARIP